MAPTGVPVMGPLDGVAEGVISMGVGVVMGVGIGVVVLLTMTRPLTMAARPKRATDLANMLILLREINR
jgi:hypothetical protein